MLKHLRQGTSRLSFGEGAIPRLARTQLQWAFIAGSVLIVLMATLSPFRFQFRDTLAQQSVLELLQRFWNGPSSRDDIINNLLLFMPLGFGLGMLGRQRGSWPMVLITTVLVGAGLSLTAELLQLFLPTRTSTKIDVLTNTAGTILGMLVWFGVAFALRSPRQMRLSLAVYLAITFAVALRLQISTQLWNWDDSFPLTVGNEQTGNRPWRGEVFDLRVIDRALSGDALQASLAGEQMDRLPVEGTLLADYAFAGEGMFRDSAGKLPDLTWQGAKGAHASARFTGEAWLATNSPATALSRELSQASQFTLITTVSSASSEQFGPARIVSLSNGPMQRNFTLGQDGNNLIFRLRTPGTGENGVYPQFTVPGVFAEGKKLQLAVTYDGATIRLYVDGVLQPRTTRLTKELVLFVKLIPPELRESLGPVVLRVGQREALLYQVLYQALIAVPLGLLLALLVRDRPMSQRGGTRQRVGRVVLLMTLAALAPLVFVVVPAVLQGQMPQRSDMLISFGLTLCSLALFSLIGVRRLWHGAER